MKQSLAEFNSSWLKNVKLTEFHTEIPSEVHAPLQVPKELKYLINASAI